MLVSMWRSVFACALLPWAWSSRLASIASSSPTLSSSEDISFTIHGENYTFVFPAARGGCLSNITDGVQGYDRLSKPLAIFSGPDSSLCDAATLNVLERNETFLHFTTSNGVAVELTTSGLDDHEQVALISHSMVANSEIHHATIELQTPKESGGWQNSYVYSMDGAETDSVGIANHSEGVLCVSNWQFGVVIGTISSSSSADSAFANKTCGATRSCCVRGSQDVNTTQFIAVPCDSETLSIVFQRFY